MNTSNKFSHQRSLSQNAYTTAPKDIVSQKQGGGAPHPGNKPSQMVRKQQASRLEMGA